MKFKDVLKSPVFPLGHRWAIDRSKKYYESDVTAMVRSMLQDESIQKDQRFAWDRWRLTK
jgi:hypothetical protein